MSHASRASESSLREGGSGCRQSHLPPPPGEVPQFANWGGEGEAYVVKILQMSWNMMKTISDSSSTMPAAWI